MKKFKVLFALFILPLLFYIFLITGTNNFSETPVVTAHISNLSKFKTADSVSVKLNGKISVVCFLGKHLLQHKTNALNLNEKIYKRFFDYPSFQMIAILPNGAQSDVKQLQKELGYTTNLKSWHFIFGSPQAIQTFYNSLNIPSKLNKNYYTPLSFIIDKSLNLRGRLDDEDAANGKLYGYNASIVSPLHKKMVDDIKVLLAEYRRALKHK